MISLRSLICISLVFSQACTPDKLVDDYRKVDVHDYDGAQRNFNLLGGDYGQIGIDAIYSPEKANVSLNPTATSNFWFSKFDLGACFDLTGYTAIQFEIVAPVGTSASFTLTQKSPNCVDRLVDSRYTNLKDYITPNGQKQTVTMPLTDFAKNINGGDYDFKHLKDWTINGLTQPVTITNFILKGNCKEGTNSTTSTALATTATATASALTVTSNTSSPTGTLVNSAVNVDGYSMMAASFILALF